MARTVRPEEKPRLVTKALSLAAPVAGAYLVVVFGLLIEFVIVGNEVGGAGIAALGLAGTLALVLVLSFHAIEIGAQAIIARRFGEGNKKAAGAVLDNALILSVVAGVPLALSLYGLGPKVFGAENPEIESLALTYFRWRLPSVPFLIAALAIIGFFNGIGRTRVPMYVYAAILSLNVFFCYALVGGHFFMPALGIKGAGLAQSISSVIGLAVFGMVLLQPRFRAKYHVLRFRENFDPGIIREVGRVAWPVLVQQFFGNFGIYLFMIINGKVPDDGVSLASSTIARQIAYLTYLPSLGFGIAAATMVGQALGSDDKARARAGGFTCWALGAAFMVTVGLCFILFREQLVDLFLASKKSPTGVMEGVSDLTRVKKLAAGLLIVVGCFQIFESMNTIMGKALQGAGDTFFVMKWAVILQWIVFLPLAWLLALPLGLGATGSMIALAVQLALAGSLFLCRFKRGSWAQKRL